MGIVGAGKGFLIVDVSKIPGVMRANGWINGAKLLDRWFAGAPFQKPEHSIHNYASAETSLIEMAWLLQFSRVSTLFSEMVDNEIWNSDKAKPVMKQSLNKVIGGFTPSQSVDLSTKTAIELHDLHVNFRLCKMEIFGSLDGLDAALGSFSLYVFPLAFTITAPRVVTLEQVGFHAYDSFDFNGDQSLGYWNASTNAVAKVFAPPGSDAVSNGDFRIWRTANGHGGDFPIYSDTLPFRLPKPVTINL